MRARLSSSLELQGRFGRRSAVPATEEGEDDDGKPGGASGLVAATAPAPSSEPASSQGGRPQPEAGRRLRPIDTGRSPTAVEARAALDLARLVRDDARA